MSYQPVIVMAWVSDPGAQPPQPPLGIWGPTDPRPTPPIVVPPGGAYPQPPGIWGPNDPRPSNPIAGIPGLPGYEPPLGIWGPTDPRPTPPIYFPGGGGGGQPPLGIWGPTDPRPTPPIYMPGPPLGTWGPGDPRPTNPISGIPGLPGYEPPPSFPILDPDEVPDHAEVPDLNAGSWVYVSNEAGTLIPAFVPWPLAVNPLSHNPMYPPEAEQPGEWVVIYLYTSSFNGLANAWIPQSHVTEPAAPEPATA